ncbi:MAG: PH domain-containing protein [Parvibaculum sp.]|uniref:PH domain-containing protein n=1 Tax=Parvibaculum sp. TaxID=2024848 RepID=UPI00284BDA6E|nr:PH domain-containing protein [Parvibaculum sp.]MDR3499449.1 PH domain-containing protein [Parvibaculum sp.]
MTVRTGTTTPQKPLGAARAHWTIYLPSLAVALVWAGVYAYAALHQPVLAGLRGLALAVMLLGVPLLLFSAALRARVLVVEERPARLAGGAPEFYARSGFARPREVSIGASEISSLRVRRSLPQRIFGGGALDLRTLSGDRLIFADLDRPDAVAAALAAPAHSGPGHKEPLR